MDSGEGMEPLTPNDQNTLESSRVVQGLVKGKLYKFSYRVMNVNGWSSMSDSVYIRAAIVPSKPDAPTLIQATSTSIQLQFYKPTDNGGSEIANFKLFRNNGDSSNEPTTEVLSYTSNLLTHTLTVADDSLTTGLLYKFKFRAINLVGNSEDSNIVEYALVDKIEAPQAPTVMLDHTSESQIAVEWSAVGQFSPAGY